jgi:hypothetical protein
MAKKSKRPPAEPTNVPWASDEAASALTAGPAVPTPELDPRPSTALDANEPVTADRGALWFPLAAAGVLVVALFVPGGAASAALEGVASAGWPGAFAHVGQLSLLITLAAAALAVAAAVGRAQPARAVPMAVVGGLLALVGSRLHALADPRAPLGMAEPLRDSLHGLPTGWLITVALAGLWLLLHRRNPTHGRWTLALGGLGLTLHAWQPAGWLGQSLPPALAALTGLDAVGSLPSALAGRAWVLSEAIAGPSLILTALRPAQPRSQLVAGLAGLALWQLSWLAQQGAGVLLHEAGAGLLAAWALVQALEGTDLRRRLALPAEVVAVPALVGVYLLLKTNGLRYSSTDEGLYFYAAKLWADGKLPYRDFFFSHPPLHIALPALLYKLGGYHFLVGKWLSALAALGGALAVWRMARRHLGIWQGVLALGLTLMAGEVLQASTNLTGINLTTGWLMWGLWAASRRRFLLSGVLLGAAASTGFYAIGGFLAVGLLAAFLPWPKSNPRWQHPLLHLAGGFLLVWGVLNLWFWAQAGDRFVDGVYGYHFAKKAKVEGFRPISEGPVAWLSNLGLLLGAKDFRQTLYMHAAHWWLALWAPLGVLAGAWARGKATLGWHPRRWWAELETGGLGPWLTLITGLLLAEFAQFKERYDFYYALLLPLVSLCAVVTLDGLVRMGRLALEQGRTLPRLAFVGGLALAVCWVPVCNDVNAKTYPDELRATGASQGAGEVLRFEWLDPPGPAWVSGLTRGLVWQDHRIRGNLESGVHHYLWGKKRWFSVADEMAAYIRTHSEPTDSLTGASDYAPLLALLSGRRLAGDQVDTNSKVFNTGAVKPEDFWTRVCGDRVKFLVVAPQSWFAADALARRPNVTRDFERVAEFHDRKLKHFGKTVDLELWQRKREPPGPVCGP